MCVDYLFFGDFIDLQLVLFEFEICVQWIRKYDAIMQVLELNSKDYVNNWI